jgi:hypothetical protein
MPYGGYDTIPNLTAITPAIVVARVAGVDPLNIHAHAAETTVTFSDGGAAFLAAVGRAFDPWRDLEFTWDFGDASGTETFTHPVTGATVNANTDQTGPEAAYVYRAAGSYTITLTARAWTGSAYVTASTTSLKTEGWHQYEVLGAPTGGTYTLTLAGETTGTIAWDAYQDLPTVQSSDASCPIKAGDGITTPFNSVQAALDDALGAGRVYVVRAATRKRFGILTRGNLTGVSTDALTADASGLTGGTSPTVACARQIDGATATGITVSAFSGSVMYFDSVAGSDSNDGLTIGAPKQTWTAIKAFWTGSNKRAYLKRGSTWSVTGTSTRCIIRDFTDMQVIAYGTGDAPLVEDATGDYILFYTAQAHNATGSGLVLDGIRFSDHGMTTEAGDADLNGGSITGVVGGLRHILFSRCEFTSWLGFEAGQMSAFNTSWWGCTFTLTGVGSSLITQHIACTSVVGGSCAGGGADSVREHHLYYTTNAHLLGRWIDFQQSDEKNACSKTTTNDYREGGRGIDCALFDGCDVTGTGLGLGFGNHNARLNDTTVTRGLVQNCAIHDCGNVPGGNGKGIYFDGPLVIRDNLFYDNLAQDIDGSKITSEPDIYRNKFWRSATAGENSITLSLCQRGIWRLNTLHSEHAAVAGSGVIYHTPTALAAWKITANQYFAPSYLVSSSVKPFRNASANQTFAEWQALGPDTDGTYADPGWLDPENGDFRTTTTKTRLRLRIGTRS